MPVHTNTKYAGTADGSIPPSMADMSDPLIGLARASAVTEKIKLGTAISLVPEHNPLIQAKQIATLDRLSNGRFIFGIGAGWLAEETEIMGGDFEHRWSQAREAILAMKELWTKDEAEIVLAFADYYRDGGRATNGWSDPVAALVRTLPVQIAKGRKGHNRPPPKVFSVNSQDFAAMKAEQDARRARG